MKEAEKIIKKLVGPPTLQSDLGDHGSLLNLSFAQTVLPSLLILCGDVESNPGPESQLTIDDHFEVTEYLGTLLPQDLIRLGGALGLQYSSLKLMNSLCGDMVLAWFNQQDNVMKKSGKPTWESLMKALRTIGHEGLAQKIAQGVQQLTSDTPTPSDMNTEDIEPAPSTVSSSSSSDMSAVELIPCFPLLPTDGMSEKEKRSKMRELQKETERLKAKFTNLVFDLQKSVEEKCTLDDLHSFLTYHEAKFEELLQGCKTIPEAFRKASKFWSFYDRDLIKLLMNRFGTIRNKETLKDFRKRFQDYSKRRICECPSNTFGNEEESEKMLSLKSEMKVDKTTVEEFEKLEHAMRRALGGPVLRLLHIEEGCIELKYRALDNNIMDAITEEQQLALQSLGFVNISYGDQSLNLSSCVITDDKGKDPASSVLSLVGEMAALKVKGIDDTDSAFGTVSDITGTSIATYSDDGRSTFTSGLGTFQDYVGRDLKDPRLDMIVSAEITTKQSLELHHAADIGDLEEVKRLITKGLNPLTKDGNDNTSLHYAALNGRLEVLNHLIESELCNPAPLGQYGMTPLHSAAEAGHLNIVQYLVEKHQVDPLKQNKNGYSPLHSACKGGNLEVVKYLMETMLTFMKMEDIFKDFTKYQTSPIHIAALNGHIDILKYFIHDCNCDPNLPSGVHGGGPLHAAAQEGHLSIVKFLIMECGCDPESRNDKHATPLHLAAQLGHLSVVKYLCEDMRCDPFCRNKRNNTPLHNAALDGHSDVCDYFINIFQCNPNVPGQYGRRPLHHASQEGHLYLVKNLIENHACDPNSLDDRNSLPVHIASGKGHLSTIRYLTEVKGCNAMLQDKKYGTALHWAAEFGQLTTIKYFIEQDSTPACPSNGSQ